MKKKKLTARDLAALRGQRIGVHYNLHQCRRDAPPKPGEACWAVKVGDKVIGYTDQITLSDVDLLAQPKGLARIKQKGQREVVAWAKGTLQGGAIACKPLTINPFKDKSFVVIEGKLRRPVKHAERAVFSGRRAQACGKVR